jgi:peptidyl-prolyl cis-trans isomerase B (cyclophilin B)
VLSSVTVRRCLLTLAVALTLAACGSSSSSSSSSSARGSGASTSASSSAAGASTSPTGSAAQGGAACRTVPVPAPKPSPHLSGPQLALNPARTYTVTIVTNCGTFAFTLDVKQSPKTAASFYSLVKRRFFDGLTFHRVAAGFVIQGGDPTRTGAGGPGYTVVEPPPPNTQYVRGDVAMAKTEAQPAGASGSQFFIVTTADATQSAGLTPDYALLGKVVSGLDVVEKIGALPTTPAGDGEPTPAVVMSSVTVAAS